MLRVALVLLLASGIQAAIDEKAVKRILDEYAALEHKLWNMSLAVAFYSPTLLPGGPLVASAAGYTNAGLLVKAEGAPRAAQPDDLYVWGSITKIFTGPAVLQLVDKGLVNLEDKISTHIDPFLQKANGTKLSDHFGPDIDKVQIHHLLHMTSGIHDYDRGNYSQDQFASPTRDFDPIEIIGTYVPPGFDFQPGSKQSYCSTNYILLGMVLANHLGDTEGEWKSYDQRSVFPASIRADLNKSMFIDKGTCSKYTPVHGIMAPSFYDRNATSDTDVWNVSCVGGWTGGNYVGAVGDVAQYTYALYKPESTIVSKARLANMLNFSAPRSHGKFYGMATFSLDWSVTDVTSDPPVTTEGYGHVGDTYGYQSQTTYFPELDFALTVATNVESANQAQPAETTCKLYHAIAAAVQGKPDPACTFVVPRHFIGKCSCGTSGSS